MKIAQNNRLSKCCRSKMSITDKMYFGGGKVFRPYKVIPAYYVCTKCGLIER